ncbi:MAG: FtsQ-type POTRA domain-containing protein [Candidatus Omnitrophica bacterium]|nr:FtsQ-type POTRA domain-containing protein [Candidatus Omnitrophota bacterium]
MARRRRRSNGRRRGIKGILNYFGSIVSVLWQAVPWVVAASLFVIVFLGVRNSLYADGSLNVSKVVVQPPDALTQEQYRQIETGVLGQNILKVNLKKAARRLEKYPEIARAEVTRKFPSSLQVNVTQRQPVAWIQVAPLGNFGLISSDGVILDVFDQRNDSLPIVEAYGVDDRKLQVGQKISHKGYLESVEFLKSFWKSPISKKETVTQMSLDRGGNVTVTLSEAPRIRMGQRPATRIRALEQVMPLLEREPRNNIDYIDLQYDNVIVRRKK